MNSLAALVLAATAWQDLWENACRNGRDASAGNPRQKIPN